MKKKYTVPLITVVDMDAEILDTITKSYSYSNGDQYSRGNVMTSAFSDDESGEGEGRQTSLW